jgi:hypothetical protein
MDGQDGQDGCMDGQDGCINGQDGCINGQDGCMDGQDGQDGCMDGRMQKCGLQQILCWNMIDVRAKGRRANLTGVGENCVGRDEPC